MISLIIGLIVLIFGLSIVAIVIDKVQINLQIQIDQFKKENKQLRKRVFDLETKGAIFVKKE